jgi:hypothetical protein
MTADGADTLKIMAWPSSFRAATPARKIADSSQDLNTAWGVRTLLDSVLSLSEIRIRREALDRFIHNTLAVTTGLRYSSSIFMPTDPPPAYPIWLNCDWCTGPGTGLAISLMLYF